LLEIRKIGFFGFWSAFQRENFDKGSLFHEEYYLSAVELCLLRLFFFSEQYVAPV
jgi:hypothetical protein